jgi:hypothetical protein
VDCRIFGTATTGLIGGGFLPPNFAAPTPKFASAAITLTAANAAIVIAGNQQAGQCTVTVTPQPSATADRIDWIATNSGAAALNCGRSKTGVGT